MQNNRQFEVLWQLAEDQTRKEKELVDIVVSMCCVNALSRSIVIILSFLLLLSLPSGNLNQRLLFRRC
jgi:hypothetical protein